MVLQIGQPIIMGITNLIFKSKENKEMTAKEFGITALVVLVVLAVVYRVAAVRTLVIGA